MKTLFTILACLASFTALPATYIYSLGGAGTNAYVTNSVVDRGFATNLLGRGVTTLSGTNLLSGSNVLSGSTTFSGPVTNLSNVQFLSSVLMQGGIIAMGVPQDTHLVSVNGGGLSIFDANAPSKPFELVAGIAYGDGSGITNIAGGSVSNVVNLTVTNVTIYDGLTIQTNLTVNNNFTVKGKGNISGNLFVGSLTSTNGITNQTLTASTVLVSGGSKQVASLANAAGSLTNDGAGVLGYYNGASGQGSGLTNLTYRYTTNAITALTLSYGQAYFTNLAANVTLALDAPGSAFFETAVLWVTNASGSDFTVTFPAGVVGTPGSGSPPTYYCTNRQQTRLLVEHYGASMTNAFKLDFAP